MMKTVLGALVVCLTVAGVSACDNMTTRQRDTAIGAAGGGVAGALLGGGTLGTLGGAAAGGLIGNQVGK
jgi:osmotically inducible lipoprotein OsmB